MFYITGLYRQWSDASGVAPPSVVVTPEVGGIGHKKRHRHRYLIDGRLLLLTDEELRAYLLRLVRRKARQQEARPAPEKAKPPATAEPIAVAADFGLLSPQLQAQPYVQAATQLSRASWAQSQPEILRVLHALAHGLEADAIRQAEEDDEDVIVLLM